MATKFTLSGMMVAVLACSSITRAADPGNPPPAPAQRPPAGYSLAWSDEFDGDKVDPGKWFFRADKKMRSVQSSENVSLKDGNLVLSLKLLDKPDGPFVATGGGIISRERFHYGYYETRAKLGDGIDEDHDGRSDEGWHHSFWCQMAMEDPKVPGTVNTSYPQERRTEIDCFENASSRVDVAKGHPDDDLAGFTQHVIVWKPDAKNAVKEWGRLPKPPADEVTVDKKTANDWHTYAFEWTPEYVQFYVDGKATRRANYSASKFEQSDVNVWITAIAASWTGPDIEASEARYDYVRYYAPPKK